jgi:hypothetical protein
MPEDGGAPTGRLHRPGHRQDRRNVYLKRIAVTQPENGIGRRFFAATVDWGFRETEAHRF